MKKATLHIVGDHKGADLDSFDDDDLIVAVKADSQEAFEVLVRRHQKLVFALASRFLGDRGLGRDVTQDVFLALWAERKRYRPQGKFRSYLVTVTINRCRYLARQRGSHQKKLENLKIERPTQRDDRDLPLRQLIELERSLEIRGKLTLLPERMRQVIILRFTHEMSLEEIARLTDLPLGTVKSHLSRGLKRLHRLWIKGVK